MFLLVGTNLKLKSDFYPFPELSTASLFIRDSGDAEFTSTSGFHAADSHKLVAAFYLNLLEIICRLVTQKL